MNPLLLSRMLRGCPARWWFPKIVLLSTAILIACACGLGWFPPWSVLALAVGVAFGGVVADTAERQKVVAEVERDAEGRARGFTLSLGAEKTFLEPGRNWSQVDRHKWVTRGLIESPQSFAVHADGSVSLNGEVYHPADPEAARALGEQINKRHAIALEAKPKPAAASAARPQASDRVQFRVRLDPLGHLLVEGFRGPERIETGLRGLQHLIVDGWMTRPSVLHVDPLQRYVEIDDHRFECNPAGAEQLQSLLNERYAPKITSSSDAAIEVRENAAAATGFDIRFTIFRAGAKFEIKGHLSQDKLDLLQDRERCDLLQPGIILRLSPPYLYVRRRRPDGGEEHIPEFPDIKYRGITASELQRLLNHPTIRRGGKISDADSQAPPAAAEPASHRLQSAPAATPESRPGATNPPVAAPAGTAASIADVPVVRALPASKPTEGPKKEAPEARKDGVVVPTVKATELDPAIAALFAEREPHDLYTSLLQELSRRLLVPIQDVLLSLPRVFEDRRFEVLSFDGTEVESVLQLRGGNFYGFYLTHLAHERIDLVYACRGTHLEWGTDKCAVQPALGAETIEFRGSGLKGLAQNRENHFVFLVTARYREWIRPHETVCAGALARFLTVEEWARERDAFPLIWPVA